MAERSPTGRFVKRGEWKPPAGPEPERAPIALTIRPIDAEPGEPGTPPPDAPPIGEPGAEGEPGPEAPATAAILVALVDGLIGRALGPEYQAADPALDEVKERAAPVIVRAASLVGAGDLAARALPPWADELVKLGAAVYVAWGDAIGEAWSRAVAARREEQDAAGGSGGADHPGDVGRAGGRGPGGDGAADAAAAAAARPVGPDGPPAPAAGYGDLLARRAAATRGIGPRPG